METGDGFGFLLNRWIRHFIGPDQLRYRLFRSAWFVPCKAFEQFLRWPLTVAMPTEHILLNMIMGNSYDMHIRDANFKIILVSQGGGDHFRPLIRKLIGFPTAETRKRPGMTRICQSQFISLKTKEYSHPVSPDNKIKSNFKKCRSGGEDSNGRFTPVGVCGSLV